MGNGDKLQPDRLPDAGGAGVVAIVGIVLAGLLAAGDHGVALVVLDVDGDNVVPFLGQRLDIKEEGSVAAFVAAGLLTVDINGRIIIGGAYVQANDAGKLRGRKLDGLLIPDTVYKIGVGKSRQFALGAEGDGYGAAQGSVFFGKAPCQAGPAVVDLKSPGAVQVLPAAAAELGLGIFGAWDGCRH